MLTALFGLLESRTGRYRWSEEIGVRYDSNNRLHIILII
jgi:hypothetical protein